MMNEMITLSIECPICHKEHHVFVFENDYLDYTEGKLAQNAFWYLSSGEREQIISHLCPKCQESIFGSDEEDEDDEGDDLYLCEIESLGANWF